MVTQQKGFSLVELMIGLGVGTLVSLALVDATKLVAVGKKGQATQSNAAIISSMISQNLRFQTTCVATFNNGGANIPYNRDQALSDTGMPIALTVNGIRAGATANTNQIMGANNTVSIGAAPVFNGATSDLRIYNLQINRLAFKQLAENGAQRFGYVYADFQVPNTSTIFGGNTIRRKILGGVVLDAAGASVTNCYGNSPQTNLNSICTGMGCTWTAPNCNCPKAEFTCGPGELFWGVSAGSGLPICKELGGGACPPGQYVSGLGLERVICSAVPDEPIVLPSTDCAGTSLSWTASGNTCTGTATLTANGGSLTISDSTTPTTGGATFTCNSGTWSAPTGATCSSQCAGGNLSWTVGSNTCEGTAAATTSGGSITLTDATTPSTGSAGFSCNTDGTWSAPASATCTTTPTSNIGARCDGPKTFLWQDSSPSNYPNPVRTQANCKTNGGNCIEEDIWTNDYGNGTIYTIRCYRDATGVIGTAGPEGGAIPPDGSGWMDHSATYGF